MFVGRLLTEIFNPVKLELCNNFHQVFFLTQYTTSLLYDPLLPLFKRAGKDPKIKERLGHVMSEFFNWAHGRELDTRKYRNEIAWLLGEAIARHGLQEIYIGNLRSGALRPETLLFSVFGVPGHVELK